MGEMKHTPGPRELGGGNVDWAVEPDDENVGYWSSQPVGPMGRIDPVCMVIQRGDEGYRSGDDELDANAHLIAASPDLLEATKDTLASLTAAVSLLKRGSKKAAPSDKIFDQMILDHEASIERARAALSKAEGRSLSSASGQEGGE
ncbi:hypothetical protein [Aureimonas ureilytica]|uniref:hypothetical protein n=1 Tax=Aureimonas ureilytica TaxID=401562 RepID=UPI0012DC1F1F|nr:hypothetical protein [Aureimonas ureilytica]